MGDMGKTSDAAWVAKVNRVVRFVEMCSVVGGGLSCETTMAATAAWVQGGAGAGGGAR